jgi:parallel beta-helix repeat protein
MSHRRRNRLQILAPIWTAMVCIPLARGVASQEVGLQNTQSPPAGAPAVLNVRDFGASGDGKSLDTAAIKKAVKMAAALGGATVLFPPGKYVTGTFELVSNVTLDLEAGAVIEGSKNLADYGSIYDYGLGRDYGVNYSGEGSKLGLIVARDVKNISIIGRGAIDGNGDDFFDFSRPHVSPDFDARYTRQGQDFMNPKYGTESGPVDAKPEGRPGTMIILLNAKNVLLREVTLRNAPNWTLHLANSEDALVTGVHIKNNPLLPNNDGIDCIGSHNVHFSDCDIQAGDDDFAFMSSENVNVTNCSVMSNSAGVRLEDTRYSTFDNLSIHSNRGIAVFDRGEGVTAHVLFSNITLETRLITGHWWGKAEPIYIATRAGSAGKGVVRDVRFTNITGEAEGGIVIYGSPGSIIRDITFDQIRLEIRAPKPSVARSVGGNFDLRWTATSLANAVFKHDIPAIYCRYVDGFKIKDFKIVWGNDLPDYFSNAIECENFHDLSVTDLDGRQAFASSQSPAITLRRGSSVSIRNSRAARGTGVFVSLSDVSGERLFVDNDLSQARQAFRPKNARLKLYGNEMPN